MNRSLYLHETVDVIGQGQYEYMEHLWKDPVLQMPEMFGLQGSFYVCAAGGGRWPQVINIWDIGSKGWKGWASNVDRLNLKRRKAFYGDWWDEAAKWRSGGFDRLCGGAPGSPTTAEIAAQGIRGSLFVHEIQTVRPAVSWTTSNRGRAARAAARRSTGTTPLASTRCSAATLRWCWYGRPTSRRTRGFVRAEMQRGACPTRPSRTTASWRGTASRRGS